MLAAQPAPASPLFQARPVPRREPRRLCARAPWPAAGARTRHRRNHTPLEDLSPPGPRTLAARSAYAGQVLSCLHCATGEKTKKHSSWFCEWHGARSASAGAAKLGSPAPALDMSRQLRRRVGGGGGGGGGSAKICSVCNESKGKGCFSKRQWNQIPDKRKCMDCTEEGGVQGRGGGGRGGAVGNRLLQAPPPARTGAASVNQQAEDTSGISWHRCLSNSFTLSLSRARSLSLSLDR